MNLSRVRSLCADSEGALHFLQKAHEILGQVVETPLDSRSDDSVVLSLVLLTCEPIALQKKVGHLLIFYRALVDMHTSLKKEQDKDRRVQKYKYPLAERLDEFDIGGVDLHNIIQWPPKLRPIPMKPIFIDIAWNYVQKYNEAATGGKGKKQEKSKESADDADATQEAPKKRGWGFFYK